MRIILHNFRHYNDLTLNLPDKGITLIKGPSGCGKSTILMAISWVLYGKERNMCNHNTPKGKMFVELIMNNMIIRRQMNPGLFTLTLSDKILEDEIAQNFIYNLYGQKDLWITSSYLP